MTYDETEVQARYSQGLALHQQGRLEEAKALYQEILKNQPDHFESQHLLGVLALQAGQFTQAVELLGQALKLKPDSAAAQVNLGNALKNLKHFAAALQSNDRAIALKPDYAEAYYNRGNVLKALKQLDAAIKSFDQAILIRPSYAEACFNRGNAQKELKDLDAALKSYELAIASKPAYTEAYYNRGNVLRQLGRLEAACDSYARAAELRPSYTEAQLNCARLLQELGRFAAAVQSYDLALLHQPDCAEAYFNRALSLSELKQPDAALDSYNQALALRPDYVEAYLNRGILQKQLKQLEAAIESYDRALSLKPDCTQAYINRGNALALLKRSEAALDSYDQALAHQPDYADAYYYRGIVLQEIKRLVEAVSSYQQALALKPDYPFLHGILLYTRMYICDWQAAENQIAELALKLERGENASPPFHILGVIGSLSLQRKVAEIWISQMHPAQPIAEPIPPRVSQGKIRLGYYSADFHNHATAYLMAQLFEEHNKQQFELIAFSFGPEVKDQMRTRVAAAFDQFIDVRNLSDREVVELSRRLGIDIAVDLKGFTQDSRTGIFTLRAAPVQVSYLGYPGTLGSSCMDYLIADGTLIPEHSQTHYSEKIVYLPHSYQVNDAKRAIAEKTFTRKELELPDSGFVFCCFNNNYKITPETFSGWMRILKKVEGSVLWLFENNPVAAENLRKQAVIRGVASERLIFARRMSPAEHLARHRAADLFIDTLPYNAHTTASDALWAGLPVLTCMGEAFASRVAASLLNAVNLPELITVTQAQFEALAIELATDPARLKQLRDKLQQNRLTAPLFNSRLFARNIEEAYMQMHRRYRAGLPPAPIRVLPTKLDIPAKLQQGLALHQQGQLTEAGEIFHEILQQQPLHFDALHLQGVIAAQRKDYPRAIEMITLALPINPDNVAARCNLAAAHYNLGNAHKKLDQLDAAIDHYQQAVALKPDFPVACYNLANLLKKFKQLEAAVSSYQQAIAHQPDYTEAHYNLGNTLKQLLRLEAAVKSYERVIELNPAHAEAWYNRGITLNELGQAEAAVASYAQAIAQKPDYAEAYYNRGVVLQTLKRLDEALESYDQALSLKPNYAFLPGVKIHAKMHLCDWRAFEFELTRLEQKVQRGEKATPPFQMLGLSDSLALQRKVAEIWARETLPASEVVTPMVRHDSHPKIRLGYFSADFRNHAVSFLMAGLIDLHDRSCFEVIAFSFGADSRDEMRIRLENSFDEFIDVRHQSDKEIAELARNKALDIAIDLGGFTQGNRCCVFAMRVAPVQVNYLGYSGTMGANYIDYLIADKVLIPPASRVHYSEKIVYLPHSYMVNDASRPIADKIFSRKELDLPESGFVFCCFNNSYKITPVTFSSWMRILKQIEGSVLWLSETNATAQSHLRSEAESRGVSGKRLIFARRLPMAEHLARHRAADLFLDTLPYNAHTTASDALWAGLPVLTCLGEAFASRVAGSLLNALGLPELITETPAQFEALAIALAKEPARLKHLRQQLQENRLSAPLFDTRLFARHIEQAYTQMHQRNCQGLAPAHLQVWVDDSQFSITAKLQQGLTLHQKGLLTEANSLFAEILQQQPQHFDALHLQGVIAAQRKDYPLAVEKMLLALQLNPDNAAAHYNLGNTLKEQAQLDAALRHFDRAIQLKPDYAEAYCNRANTLKDLQQPDAALINYQQAIALKPDFVDANYNLGIMLHATKQSEAAIKCYETAIAIAPDHADAHFNLSLCLLQLGNFDYGWQEYQWRWKRKISSPRKFSQPLWLGNEPLAGKRILLYSEQGLGDTLQFCRYVPLLRNLGAQIILQVQPALQGLLTNLEGVAQLLTTGDALADFDYQCPLLSLPLAFKTELNNIPLPLHYTIDSHKLAEWQLKLGEKTRPRLGLVWSGSTLHLNDPHRSIPLADFVKLLPDGYQLVSLQNEVRAEDQETLLSRTDILHLGGQDFCDTAALCELMDIIVSVDTSVAHLAGTLAKPVYLLLPYVCDWRWLHDRNDSPWYRSVTLYRQQKFGEWTYVFERVRNALQILLT